MRYIKKVDEEPHHDERFSYSGFAAGPDGHLSRTALRLFDLSGRFLETLSSGQRQRSLVAMAFSQDTDYLLLDEPLNNLDMYFAQELMQCFRKIADRDGKPTDVMTSYTLRSVYGFHITDMGGQRIALPFLTEKRCS